MLIGIRAWTLTMTNLSPTLVKTWVMLSQTESSQISYARKRARKLILKYFGSVPIAEVYIEQREDAQIEVYVI